MSVPVLNIARWFLSVVAISALPLVTHIAAQNQNAEPAQDGFVTVNTVRLHYVDWGGTGQDCIGRPVELFQRGEPAVSVG
jgi:hypothetical protein